MHNYTPKSEMPPFSNRPPWPVYFMAQAFLAASRSTCSRRKVGAVATIENQVIATGYNGAPPSFDHCDVTGCLRKQLGIPSGEGLEICRAIHAEQNLIVQASRHKATLAGSTVYCTHSPCTTCSKLLIGAGVAKLVVFHKYPDERAEGFLRTAGVEVEYLNAGHLRCGYLVDTLQAIMDLTKL